MLLCFPFGNMKVQRDGQITTFMIMKLVARKGHKDITRSVACGEKHLRRRLSSSARNVFGDAKSMNEKALVDLLSHSEWGCLPNVNVFSVYGYCCVYCVERTLRLQLGTKIEHSPSAFHLFICFNVSYCRKVFPTMMFSLLWRCASVLLGLSCCLMGVTSSLNLEDPNVCSHWERYTTPLPTHTHVQAKTLDFNVTHV